MQERNERKCRDMIDEFTSQSSLVSSGTFTTEG